ncbi:MAG: flagellar biosynthesis protein FlhB [Dissulfurimicrobium sp.]|uniref:flagellar biosynthesis protein FlhB n=1 Tax=Dissulfurimicrobium TaxID=1769732 RepID=UPI001ED9EA05|nr:flagellar biosynthesis protein FlhB [Dissulfurimicrobium hydrothermale]UKL13478.1 flagellar biosynthesis protein FlhB [Dissulfurimicrobium hydrothermale]
MAEESFQERTEKATPKRREEARKKGQTARSRELSSVAVLLSGILTFLWAGGLFYQQSAVMLRYYLGNAANIRITTGNIETIAANGIWRFMMITGPLLFVLALVAIAANYLQVGPLISFEAIKPKFSKINPIEGLKRLFSAQAVAELLKSLLKLVIVGIIAFKTIRGEIDRILPLTDQSPIQIFLYMSRVSFAMFWKICIAIAAIAVLDFIFQKWEFEKGLRMTRQEVKEEYRETEGDPQIRARIRSIQREMARRRMMAAVPEADVVITNPTHLAVALKYETGKMEAPQVTAKGSGFIAEKIKEIAKANGVPTIENKPLAQTLFKLVEVGMTIPENLYQAVAEVLAYVYRMKNKGSRGLRR